MFGENNFEPFFYEDNFQSTPKQSPKSIFSKPITDNSSIKDFIGVFNDLDNLDNYEFDFSQYNCEFSEKQPESKKMCNNHNQISSKNERKSKPIIKSGPKDEVNKKPSIVELRDYFTKSLVESEKLRVESLKNKANDLNEIKKSRKGDYVKDIINNAPFETIPVRFRNQTKLKHKKNKVKSRKEILEKNDFFNFSVSNSLHDSTEKLFNSYDESTQNLPIPDSIISPLLNNKFVALNRMVDLNILKSPITNFEDLNGNCSSLENEPLPSIFSLSCIRQSF